MTDITDTFTTAPFPKKDPIAHACHSPWYADCDKCRAEDSAWLRRVEAWTKTAHNPDTTGMLVLQREVCRWSKRQGKFRWYTESAYCYWVTDYAVRENGDIVFRDLVHQTVWSRMGEGRAGFKILVPEDRECVLPVTRGVRNAKGYLSERWLRCEFTPLSAMSDSERAQFPAWDKFGTARDWSRSYCD